MIIDRYGGIGLVMLALLPVAAVVAWALARVRRRAGSPTRSAWRVSLTEVGIVYGTAPWVWLTMEPGNPAETGTVSLVPLRDVVTMPPYQVVGNLLVFAVLGLLIPVRFRALASVPRVMVVAAFCSLLIEVTQYVVQLGRVASVDDILLNSVGAGLAALVSRPWWRRSRGAGTASRREQPRAIA
ncbi:MULTISPECIES: VanZ family protein [unclassified Mumia]|uniref:VanZ family protein n=1 Tax=unclassified Mumia TaxID=2621872 RepID=UPI00263733D8|nr:MULTISPECIES: VanZ family protein [unclassified Mumia]MDD9349195.1 VanZ family protein [Mumia sp.]